MNIRFFQIAYRRLRLAVIALGTFLITSHPVLAQIPELQQAAGVGYGRLPETNPALIVANVINVVLGLTGMIFLVIVLYAGFEYLTAMGDDKKITKAKSALSSGVIGIVLVIAAYSISYFVIPLLVGIVKK